MSIGAVGQGRVAAAGHGLPGEGPGRTVAGTAADDVDAGSEGAGVEERRLPGARVVHTERQRLVVDGAEEVGEGAQPLERVVLF